MEEDLSGFIDGELSESARRSLIRRLASDGELSRGWAEYHLIGDVLRGTAAQPFGIDRFRAALEREPTVFAPLAVRLAASVPVRRTLSAAAAAVAVAMVGWMAWPMLQDGPLQRLVGAPGKTAVAAEASAVVPSAFGVEDYLLAHQRFSPSFAMQGAAPYVRLVDDTAKARQ